MSPPITRVRLVRHGEVAAVHKGTFYGGAEVPLSEHGAAASLELAAALAEDPPQAVFSSPLSRALAVAEPLAAHCGLAVHVDEALRELDRGDWTHLAHDEVERRWPGAIEAYRRDPEGGAAPGGESESVFAGRVWSFLDATVAAHAGGDLVMVAHGHVIRVALRRLLDQPPAASLASFVPYHAVVELELGPDGGGRVLNLPEGHLPSALRPRG